jgi:hypothetical protein
MASIDKTYLTKKESVKFFRWYHKNKSKMKKDLGYNIFLMSTKKDFKLLPSDSDLPIWSTSTIEDIWIYKNCKLKSIRGRIKGQYPKNWIGFLDFKFEKEIRIFSITENGTPLYFFKDCGDGTIDWLEEMISYGTTYVFELIDKASKVVSNPEDSLLDIKYSYCGLDINFKNGRITKLGKEYNKEITTGYTPKGNVLTPTIKHSYNLKDIKKGKYVGEAVILSHKNEAFDMMSYKNGSLDNIKRYIRFLPDFIQKNIKG